MFVYLKFVPGAGFFASLGLTKRGFMRQSMPAKVIWPPSLTPGRRILTVSGQD